MPKIQLNVGAKLGELRRKLGAAGGMVRRWGHRLKRELRGVGLALKFGGITAVIGAIGSSIRETYRWRKEIAQVNTLLRLPKREFREMRKEVRGVAKELGLGLTDAAKAAYDAISAGIGQNNLKPFLQVAGKSAIAGATDISTAVDALTTVINAYGFETSEASMVSDHLFQIVKDGKITFSELANNISKLAPIAKTAGVSFSDLSAMIATAVKVEKPERAMTALRAMIRDITKQGKDLKTTLVDLKGASLEEIFAAGFSSEAAQGIALLTGNFQTLLAEVNAMESAVGEMGRAFDVMAEDPTQQLRIAMADLRDHGIELGNTVLPNMARSLSWVARVANDAAQGIKNVSKGAAYDATTPLNDKERREIIQEVNDELGTFSLWNSIWQPFRPIHSTAKYYGKASVKADILNNKLKA